MSNKVALYVFGEGKHVLQKKETAVVTTFVEDNVVCRKIVCMNTAMENSMKRKELDKKAAAEYTKILSNAKVCDNCLKASPDSHRCSKCLSTQYCSKECLLEDWKFHKKVCDKWAEDKERRQMPGGREQTKAMKKHVEASLKKCNRPDCENNGLHRCKRCMTVSPVWMETFQW